MKLLPGVLGLGGHRRAVRGPGGGASVTSRLLSAVWGFPNVHGDVAATASYTGGLLTATDRSLFDPSGNPLGVNPDGTPDPTPLPDNAQGNFDFGWLGQHQRPTEHAGDLATIEMGARPYVPALGRWLSWHRSSGSCTVPRHTPSAASPAPCARRSR